MDFNVVVLAGRLTAPPEVRSFESGSRLVRFLVTVRSITPRRRVDVVPVTLWEPDRDHPMLAADVGSAVWVAGSVQRRFWTEQKARRSQLEVVASDVCVADEDDRDGWSAITELVAERSGHRVE